MSWLHLLALSGCSEGSARDDSTSPADDSAGDDSGTKTQPPVLAGACENGTRVGGFELSHQSVGVAYVFGQVFDGALPTSKLTPLESAGGCTMMRQENPFCNPTCEPNFTCSLDGVCVPYPVRIDVGTVDITGASDPITMEPRSDLTYWDQGAELPVFAPGAAISLHATGAGEIAPFDLHGTGVDELAMKTDKLLMAGGEDLQIAWEPAATLGGSMFIALAIDEHGATPVTLYCDVEDTGSLAVPSKFVDTLIKYGVSGFPTAYVYRRTIDHVITPAGCVELTVDVQKKPLLGVVGHTPCSSDANCPKEQHCDLAIQTCVDD